MDSKPWKQNGGNRAAADQDVQGEELGRAEETDNRLAIVPTSDSLAHQPSSTATVSTTTSVACDDISMIGGGGEVSSAREVRREEVDSKISAWETEEMAKIHNRFKRVEAIINGWEDDQVEKATSCLRKVERKLEEERARALEKMENDVAGARQKAEEKMASIEGKRGEKVSKVLESAKLMKILGRPPSKRSFF